MRVDQSTEEQMRAKKVSGESTERVDKWRLGIADCGLSLA